MILVSDGSHKDKSKTNEKIHKPLNILKEEATSPLPSPTSTKSDDRKNKKKSSGNFLLYNYLIETCYEEAVCINHLDFYLFHKLLVIFEF